MKSTTLSTTPATMPPTTTRPQLILPIGHLAEGRDGHFDPLRRYPPARWRSSKPAVRLCVYASVRLALRDYQHAHHPAKTVRHRRYPVWYDPGLAVQQDIEVIDPAGQ